MATYETRLNLGAFTNALQSGARAALQDAAEHLLAESNKRVPIDEGTLERSSRAEVVSDTEATVSYDTPYAAKQHEDLTLRHKNGRQAKYLESAINAEKNTLAQIIADRLRQELTR